MIDARKPTRFKNKQLISENYEGQCGKEDADHSLRTVELYSDRRCVSQLIDLFEIN